MMASKLKEILVYALILAAGLLVGYVVSNFKELTRKSYIESDFSKYYPNAQTKVIVYGTSTCPWCIKTREFLNKNQIVFLDLDVEKSEQAKKDFEKLNGEGYPLILIGNRLISGFDQNAIEEAIKKLGKG